MTVHWLKCQASKVYFNFREFINFKCSNVGSIIMSQSFKFIINCMTVNIYINLKLYQRRIMLLDYTDYLHIKCLTNK